MYVSLNNIILLLFLLIKYYNNAFIYGHVYVYKKFC